MSLRKLIIRWKIARGRAVDIWSKSPYPANVLSNLHSNGFRFDGMVCGSMEGFLQSLKHKNPDKQRQICSMKGRNAKNMSASDWLTDQIVWWRGKAIDRQSEEFMKLVGRAYRTMFEQNKSFRTALMSTRGMTLHHTKGERNPFKTILTEKEFCSILTDIREQYDKRDKQTKKPRKRIFVDMDGVLVDFQSGINQQDEETLKAYEGRLDEIPGVFTCMKPMPGAIDAIHELQKHFDLYILSSALWESYTALSDKMQWIRKYLDDVFLKRVIITHCKNLCKGDYLIDDRGKNGTREFEGEWIRFGNSTFPNWNAVVNYLCETNGINKPNK
jgi:hypothetical protein